MITKETTAGMTREQWVSLRAKTIGGSDAACIVGLNPFKSAYSLWAEKTGKTPAFTGNLATEVGTFLEPFVAQLFEKETGKKVRRENAIIRNSEHPFAHANVDRMVIGEDAGLEIKTTSALSLGKFKGGEYPANYYVQCVHYMAVTGKKRWYLAVLIGNSDFRIFTIERDEDEIRALMEAERTFWEHWQSNTPVEPDGSESTSDAIHTIYRGGSGDCDLMPVSSELMMVRKLDGQIKELQKLSDEHKNRIMSYMGNCESGAYGDFRVTWKPQTRQTFDHRKFRADHPMMDLTPYYKTSESRPFKLKEA